MAEVEPPPRGGFYLTPRPVHSTQGARGSAALPPASVFVVAATVRDKPMPFVDGAIEVTGVFEVGTRADEHGHVSSFRILLDPPASSQLATN
jgi:hypothetical protein